MNLHPWKTPIATMLLVVACAGTAHATELDPTSIPAILVEPSDPVATPEPTCGICAIVVKPPSASASTTTLVIPSEHDFHGDVEVVVWLCREERASVWLEDVTIAAGTALELEVDAGLGWDWSEVELVWTRLYPTE